jgi:hypothetical protein
MKTRPPRSFRPLLERLEDRLTPAGNVTSSFTGGSLTLTGDALANAITISEPTLNGPLVVTPNGTTTLDGQSAAEGFTVTGNLTIQLGAGNDSISFDLGPNPITVPGTLSILYGSNTGDKLTQTINAVGNAFTVGQNLAISYGAGAVTTKLDNLQVGSNSVPRSGNVTITHGAGNSTTTIESLAAGQFDNILGNLSVTNTSGVADNQLFDTNVGGNVTFNNGKAGAGNVAGFTVIANFANATQATIGGNVAITNQNGNATVTGANPRGVGDFIGDVHIRGNVTLKLGTGNYSAFVTSDNVPQAPQIDGNLSITGTGSDVVDLGVFPSVQLPAGFSHGLNVNGSLSVLLGGAGADTLDLTGLVVGKDTNLTTGSGNASVTVNDIRAANDSEFHGAFNLTTGAGNDTVEINGPHASGSGDITFDGAVSARLGLGNDTLSLATNDGVSFLGASATFDGQGGTNHAHVTNGNITGLAPTLLNFING